MEDLPWWHVPLAAAAIVAYLALRYGRICLREVPRDWWRG